MPKQPEAPHTQEKLSAPDKAHAAVHPKARRGKSRAAASRKRGGKHLREAEGNAKLAKEKKLREKAQKHGATHRTMGFSALQDALHSATGWQGRLPAKEERAWVLKAYESGEIKHALAHFHRASCDV